MKAQIGIIGGEDKNLSIFSKEKIMEQARIIGKIIAENDCVLIGGGCSGVAEAASKAAFENNGIVIGTPGPKRGSGIPWLSAEICTPNDIGDYLIAGIPSSDVLIVFPGGPGTITELALAYRYKKPLVTIKGECESFLKNVLQNILEDYPLFIEENAESCANKALLLAKELIQKMRLK